MGRLPEYWAGRKITMRVPYEMAAEVTLTTGQSGVQFADAAFLHNVDKPFEIHRCKPFITQLDAQGDVMEPQITQETLQSLLRVKITDLGINEPLTKSPTLIPLLTKGSAEQTWEWAEPRTIVRSENFQITVDALGFTEFENVVSLRLAWGFQGFLLVVAPPSESR
jgi:hypothetical protein